MMKMFYKRKQGNQRNQYKWNKTTIAGNRETSVTNTMERHGINGKHINETKIGKI